MISPLLALHGQGDVGVFKLHVDALRNELMETLHRLSLDEPLVLAG